MIPFREKLKRILKEKGISTRQFEIDTGICKDILYYERKTHKSMLMGLAYYLEMKVEDMIEGTDAEDIWYS